MRATRRPRIARSTATNTRHLLPHRVIAVAGAAVGLCSAATAQGLSPAWMVRAWEREPPTPSWATAPVRSDSPGYTGASGPGGFDSATDAHWALPINGNWSDAQRWTTNPFAPNNGTPGGATYNGYLDAVGPAHMVTLNSGVTLDNLYINSSSVTLDHRAGALSVGGVVDLLSGTYSLEGGTLRNATLNLLGGTFTVHGNTDNLLDNVTVNGSFAPHFLRLANGLTLNGTLSLLGNTSQLSFDGSQTVNGGIIEFGNPTFDPRSVMISRGSTLTLSPSTIVRGGLGRIGDPGIYTPGTGPTTLINQGLISANISGRELRVVSDAFTNTGTIEAINGGRLTIDNLNGNVNTARSDGVGSAVTLAGTYTNNGTLNVTNGASLTLNGSWNNTGLINLSGGSTLNLGGQFSHSALGTINRSGGLVRLTGVLNNTGSSLTLNSSTGPWLLAGGTIQGGSIDLLDGVTLNTDGTATGRLIGSTLNGVLNIQSGGRVSMEGAWVNNGTININAGTLDLGGTFASSGLGAINRTGGTVNLTGTVQNTGGSLDLTAATGSWNLVGGSIVGGSVNTSGGSRLISTSGPAGVVDQCHVQRHLGSQQQLECHRVQPDPQRYCQRERTPDPQRRLG
jgi:hypothetical protein